MTAGCCRRLVGGKSWIGDGAGEGFGLGPVDRSTKPDCGGETDTGGALIRQGRLKQPWETAACGSP